MSIAKLSPLVITTGGLFCIGNKQGTINVISVDIKAFLKFSKKYKVAQLQNSYKCRCVALNAYVTAFLFIFKSIIECNLTSKKIKIRELFGN